MIEGAEYATRLKEHFVKMQGEHAMFDWAKPREERRRKAAQESDDEEEQPAATKMLADSASEDSEEDPIGDLLKSNTAIFSKSE